MSAHPELKDSLAEIIRAHLPDDPGNTNVRGYTYNFESGQSAAIFVIVGGSAAAFGKLVGQDIDRRAAVLAEAVKVAAQQLTQ